MTVPIIFTPKVVGEEKLVRWWNGHPNSYGKNPYGKPLYRIVWSESRSWMLGGLWPDGSIEYRWVPYYAGRKEWVLEKWLSPMEYAGTEESWQRDTLDYELCAKGIVMYAMGPYPARGCYEHCYSFPSDAEPKLDAIVPILESAKTLSLGQIKAGLRLWHDRQRKEWDNKVEDGIMDAMPAFHGNPTNIAPAKPHADTGGLLEPGAAKVAVAKYRGASVQQKDNPSPQDLMLPSQGFSIRQRKG